MNTKEPVNSNIWEVRASGLPKIFVAAPNRAAAEAGYKAKLNISTNSTVIFHEVIQCQVQPNA